jgi:hypothetical protein
MNSCSLLVQIISLPTECLKQEEILFVKIKVQLQKLRKKRGFDQFYIYIWGDLSEKVVKEFRVGDYIIIEGLLSFNIDPLNNQFNKQIKFTVLNICPFLLVDTD